ncbi:MAG: hypothetical protein SVV03_03690 [Candidatus Nanohaloarchaea archaeon]|nr:hypothetical protein [Candidatus Nanohaloarchaea archaeon]
MKIKKKDSEEFRPDETSVVREYILDDSDLSVEVVDIDGTHEVDPDSEETVYYTLEGEGHIHLSNRIIEMEKGDLVHLNRQKHTLEGDLTVLKVKRSG